MQSCIKLEKARAKLRGCKDDSYFEGVVCTNRCNFRGTCGVKRIPFLIQAQANKVILRGVTEQINGIICSVDSLISFRKEEYIIGGVER